MFADGNLKDDYSYPNVNHGYNEIHKISNKIFGILKYLYFQAMAETTYFNNTVNNFRDF